MGDIIKLAIRLFIFALVASVALAVTNEVTKGPIEAQKLASKMEALNTVLPGCDYEQIEYEGISEDSVLDELFVGKIDGEIQGYALTAAPQGYGGEIPITLGVSVEGYVTQVYVGALQETAGLGSRVGESEFKDQFIAIAADPDTLRDDVDTLSGATVSSSAFVNAVSDMLTYTKDTLGIEPHAGDKDAVLAAAAAAAGEPAEPVVTTATYDVTGFQPMKVEVSVDDSGKIVSVSVPEHNETPGLGADLIADTAVFDALVGQDIATARIDVKSGVTLTSNAINDALRQAGPQVPTDPYTVKGFDKFTLNIAVQDGKIAAVSADANNETPGLGADLLTDEALSALIGQDITTAQIDIKSGVTLTSTAINSALKQAAAANGFVVEAEEPDVQTSATAETEPSGEEQTSGAPSYEVTGFQPFTVEIAVDADGKIVSVSVPVHSETPGLGAALIEDASVFDALVGQDIATAQIDVKAGVTLTSNAINDALKQAAAAAPVADAQTADATDVPAKGYEVTGFQPFTLMIAVDENGEIASVSADGNNETPGIGGEVLKAENLSTLVGQDIATAQLDAKTGATLTTNAVNEALKQAAADAGSDAAAPAEAAAKSYDVTGFQPFTVEIAVDADGKIVSVSVPAHSETPGLGAALIEDASVFDALVGQDIATAQIDVKSGVTLTSNAINDALKQAAAKAAPAEEVVPAEAAAKSYDVTGFQPFTVEIAVDADGKIVSVSVPAHSETPGLGAALIEDASVFDALVGQDIATAQIDVKAGVTLTSNAINDALKQAAKEVQ